MSKNHVSEVVKKVEKQKENEREIRIHYDFLIVSLLSNCLGEYSYS